MGLARASGRIALTKPYRDDMGADASLDAAFSFAQSLVLTATPQSAAVASGRGAACITVTQNGLPGDMCDGSRSTAEWVASGALGLACTSEVDAGPPSVAAWRPPWVPAIGLDAADLGGPPFARTAERHPAVIAAPDAPLTAQVGTYYSFEWSSLDHFLETRCAVDFSDDVLRLAAAWVARGPLRGRPFAAVHVRREDFASAFPSADTYMPLSALAAAVGDASARARGARGESIADVFVLGNMSPKEAAELEAALRARGLEPHSHPLSSTAVGVLIDSAIAGDADVFVGNKQSTFSHEIAFQLVCAGRRDAVHFFKASPTALRRS